SLCAEAPWIGCVAGRVPIVVVCDALAAGVLAIGVLATGVPARSAVSAAGTAAEAAGATVDVNRCRVAWTGAPLLLAGADSPSASTGSTLRAAGGSTNGAPPGDGLSKSMTIVLRSLRTW